MTKDPSASLPPAPPTAPDIRRLQEQHARDVEMNARYAATRAKEARRKEQKKNA